jgi:F-type H+-transporting ATPase subunit b
MSESELEARRLIDDARKTAEKLKAEIVASANEQAAQMTAQAKAEIQREKETALSQLRSEVADLAIMAAGRILQENLDDDRNRKIVDSVIAGLPKN